MSMKAKTKKRAGGTLKYRAKARTGEYSTAWRFRWADWAPA